MIGFHSISSTAAFLFHHLLWSSVWVIQQVIPLWSSSFWKCFLWRLLVPLVSAFAVLVGPQLRETSFHCKVQSDFRVDRATRVWHLYKREISRHYASKTACSTSDAVLCGSELSIRCIARTFLASLSWSQDCELQVVDRRSSIDLPWGIGAVLYHLESLYLQEFEPTNYGFLLHFDPTIVNISLLEMSDHFVILLFYPAWHWLH
jgi:hypothetical protein